jgi:hypothetical protein
VKALVAIGLATALAACGETPQDAAKPYAGKEDTKPYAGDLFKGDKAKYEQALAKRADFQNDYAKSRAFTSDKTQ